MKDRQSLKSRAYCCQGGDKYSYPWQWTNPQRQWDRHDWSGALVALHDEGRHVILVTSGAIGAGVGRLGLQTKPNTIPKTGLCICGTKFAYANI